MGGEIVSDRLAQLIKAVMPSTISAKERKALFSYPGPFSSFSAKLRIGHALRLIPEEIYRALDALRELRNEAAHSSSSFSLVGLEQRYEAIFALGAHVPAQVRMQGEMAMMDFKVWQVQQLIIERNADAVPGTPPTPVPTREQIVNQLSRDSDFARQLTVERPQWQLAVGLAMICSYLLWMREVISAQLGPSEPLLTFLLRLEEGRGSL